MTATQRIAARQAKQARSQERATEAYIANHADAMALVEAIRTGLQDLPAPNDETQVTWAQAEEMGEVVRRLRSVLNFVGGKGE